MELYVVNLYQSKASFSGAIQAISAIKALHLLCELPTPGKSDGLALIVKAYKRNMAGEVKKKSPITAEIMELFWKHLKYNLGIMYWFAFSLAFTALLRKLELLNIHQNDIQVDKRNILWLTITRSKTDQWGKTITLPLCCICPKTWCPVCVYKIYSFQADMYTNINPTIFKFKYADILEKLRFSLEKIGKPSTVYGMHSFRRGGAQLLREVGIPDSVIMESGRWSSEAFQHYLKLNSKNAKDIAQLVKRY